MANELALPSHLVPTEVELEKVEAIGLHQPSFGYAVSQRVDYGATRWRAKIKFEKMRTSGRHELLAFLTLVGRLRAFYMPVYGEAQRGSGVFTELFANSTFDGTTSWTTQQSTINASGRKMRLSVAKNTAAGSPGFAQTPSVTQYAPHVLRSVLGDRNKTGVQAGTYFDGVSNYSTDPSGLLHQYATPLGTTAVAYPAVYDDGENVTVTGDWIECLFASLSRCGQVDNSPNAFLRSDTVGVGGYFTTTGLAGIADDAATSPDGTTTADRLTENSSASQHNILRNETRASVAESWCAFGMAKRGTGTRNFGLVIGSSGSDYVRASFNLGTGAVNAVTNNGTATNGRAFIVDMGQSGWYLCAVVGQLAASATALLQAEILDGSFAVSYTGDGTSSILVWRVGAAQTKVPMWLGQTTTTAVASGTSQGLTSQLRTRGWAVSINELLAAGDFVNIVLPSTLHLARLTSPLHTNAAGLGTLQFEPQLPEAAAEGAAIMPCRPLLKCVLTSSPKVRTYPPGYISDVELEVEQVF
jgi:hypothetical protein